MKYALTRTGLFHLIGDVATGTRLTLCFMPVTRDGDLPLIWEVADDYAREWLAANPRDLCRRCASAGGE